MTFTHDFSRRISTHAQDNMQTHWTRQGAQGPVTTQEGVRGVPANIVVHRIRTDLFWEDVVSTAGLPVRRFHNGLSRYVSFCSPLLSSALLSLPHPLFSTRVTQLTTYFLEPYQKIDDTTKVSPPHILLYKIFSSSLSPLHCSYYYFFDRTDRYAVGSSTESPRTT